jgi:fermentation-respiration switch protein FrsA (DUF1100 family)
VVAAAPATQLSRIVEVIGQLNDPDDVAYFMLLGWTWSHTYPNLAPSAVFTASGSVLARRLVTSDCDSGIVMALAQRPPSTEVFLPTASSDPALMADARLNDPGRVRTPAPLLIVQGTADNQVPAALTDDFVSQIACPLGDIVEYVHYPGAGHDGVTYEAVPRIVAWMGARRAGEPAPSTCGSRGDMVTNR